MSKKGTEAMLRAGESLPQTSIADIVNMDTGIRVADASMFDGMDIDQVITLEDGQGVVGIFRGEGDGVEVNRLDAKPGEPTSALLKTWRIEIDTGRVAQLVSSAQLDRRMPGVPLGAKVSIARLGAGKTRRGTNVTRYIVGVQPTAEQESGAIDVPSTDPAA